MSSNRWPKPAIRLSKIGTRASDDVETQFNAFVELYGEFADHFSTLDDEYRTEFVQSINDLFDECNFGDALTESTPDAIKESWSDLALDQQKKLLDVLVEEGVIIIDD